VGQSLRRDMKERTDIGKTCSVYTSAASVKMERIYFADFLRSGCFPELIVQMFAGFAARLPADFLRKVQYTHYEFKILILFIQTAGFFVQIENFMLW
jgi:hypothetical protein